MASATNSIALTEGLEEAKRALEKGAEDTIGAYVKINKKAQNSQLS